ncbi:ATP-binding protein [Verrucomicrobiaceae bacterium 5K15]|uniref:ATP-binding protein n=1 Tax=Oceaniferula flava TaxID=2800421 RepID=A0AAE2SB51_9BACT|nr:AAA family ATPase [Oceaniferula flavus]MBK1854633.1 ATP-binding protein [Oceaniferula flavus]MBM1135939.1 ATP-binding protein [Oceaniferula flavus]
MKIPHWASEIVSSYESGAAGCFVLHGNVNDRLLVPEKNGARLGSLQEFIMETLLPRFDVVLSYDPGQGLRIERGGEVFSQWPSVKDDMDLPDAPLAAVRVLTHYLKYCKNLQAVGAESPKVAVLIRQAHLICPAIPNSHNHELNAMASILRSWAAEMRLQEHGQAAFLISENLNGLHPLVGRSPRVSEVDVPLPETQEMTAALKILYQRCPNALINFREDFSRPARRLTGSTLSSVEILLLRREHAKKPLEEADLSELKRALVERDCGGLIDFVEPDRNFDGVIGLQGVKEWLRQDIALWKKDDLESMPMGYLFCGPVGTGKTYLVECLAGEAGVPVVTLKNFRDRWVGSTEENLEKIFALLHALGRCIVFIDEADQALGRRASGSGDSGVSSRVYSMMAKEMSDTRNRGKILWVLASSRPDLIEVDLKRPGRIDVKIPLFPCASPEEAWQLLRALCKRRGLELPADLANETTLNGHMPELLTPGAAEAIAVKARRLTITENCSAVEALELCLRGYLPPISTAVINAQIQLAVEEASDASFIPKTFQR